MGERVDPLDVMQNAWMKALDVVTETGNRAVAENVTRPADPTSGPVSDDDLLADYQRLLDPASGLLESRFAEMSHRMGSPGKAAASLVKFAQEGKRLQRKYERNTFDRLLKDAEMEE